MWQTITLVQQTKRTERGPPGVFCLDQQRISFQKKQQRNNHLLDINTETKTRQNSLNLITDELWMDLIMSQSCQFDNVVICFGAIVFVDTLS